MEDTRESAREKVKNLLELLGKDSNFDIEEEEGRLNIRIDGQHDGALIGFRGKNLHALERVISLMINKGLSEDKRLYVTVDVNGYKVNREKQIRSDIQTIAQQVLSSGKSYEMPFMPPRERKVIHDEVNLIDGLVSESVGEGENRRVIISVKSIE